MKGRSVAQVFTSVQSEAWGHFPYRIEGGTWQMDRHMDTPSTMTAERPEVSCAPHLCHVGVLFTPTSPPFSQPITY